MGYGKMQTQALGDLALIAFYYLLRVGEYTVKHQRDRDNRATKQTVQFKLEDLTFFKKQTSVASYKAYHMTLHPP